MHQHPNESTGEKPGKSGDSTVHSAADDLPTKLAKASLEQKIGQVLSRDGLRE